MGKTNTFNEAKNKKTIPQFVQEQLTSPSPKISNKAKQFLSKWD
jgi:hypothetical protein